MKKIVSILAVAAMAASMFAVDVAANAKLTSDLFSYNTGDGAMTVLGGLSNGADPDLNFAVSGDKAGAGFKIKHGQELFKISDDEKVNGADIIAMNIWFKPTDSLKLSFKENADNLFADKYNWWNKYNMASIPGGYGIEYSANGLTVKLNASESVLSKANKDADLAVGKIGAMVVYGADFGKIAVIASNFGGNDWEGLDAMTFGVGYTNTIAGIDLVADADVSIKDGLARAQGLVYVGGNAGDLGYALVSRLRYTEDATSLALCAKASYKIDAITATAKFESDDVLADSFAAVVGVDFSGNVGAASWAVKPNYNFGSKTVAVGFETALSF